jgi:RNA polymerase sigma-70 factor (ECF subfamily)
MPSPESTCWTVIQAAAAGRAEGRAEFAQRYAPVVRSYLASRWRSSPLLHELDDAVQEVFVECFKQGGTLERAERDRPGGFRAFLYGVVRNVALRLEVRRTRARERQPPADMDLNQVAAADDSLSREFDRAWVRALLREAARVQEERAQAAGAPACRRVELLKLRFHDGLPIRAIAARWQTDAAMLHHEYAKARQEFRAALAEVVAFHHPGAASEVEQQCTELLNLLG